VLSEFAGAAAELAEALVVNPYDVAAIAENMERALDMPEQERRERMKSLREKVEQRPVELWANSFLDTLRTEPGPRGPIEVGHNAASLAQLGERLAREPKVAFLLDFDGTLADIVARPELAAPVEGVRHVLEDLVGRYRLVGILTGRRAAEVERHLAAVEGLRFFGLYGLEGVEVPPLDPATLEAAREAATVVPEAWVEDKGGSVAVHYRQAPDPASAREALVEPLADVAASARLELIEGKMVIELVPPGRPLKGGALERLRAEHGLEAILYAGDDLADVDAFDALDRLRAEGLLAIKVAVRGDETPTELIASADLVADLPSGLVELLRSLA